MDLRAGVSSGGVSKPSNTSKGWRGRERTSRPKKTRTPPISNPVVGQMRVYCACSVRGDRSALALGQAVVAALKTAGHDVLTEHLFREDPGDEALDAKAVYERDMAWLGSADALVADVRCGAAR